MTAPLPWTLPGRLAGVDVSSAQQPLPWPAIAAAGVVTASVKASEARFRDLSFAAHLAGARSLGLYTGSYHYQHSADDGARQAETYADQIAADGQLTERPTLDWEDGLRVTALGPTGPRVALEHALAFLRRIWTLTGRRPTVYTMPAFMRLFAGRGLDAMLTELTQYDLFIAHYRWDPKTGHDYGLEAPTVPAPFTTFVAWQVGGNGAPRIPGVSVDVDRDVLFFDDVAHYLAWCRDERPHEAGVVLGDENPPNDPYVVDRLEQNDTPITHPGTPAAKRTSGEFPSVAPDAPPDTVKDPARG